MKRTYVTFKTIKSTALEDYAINHTRIKFLLENFKKLDNQEIHNILIKKPSNKSGVCEKMSVSYDKKTNLTVLKSYYGSTSACIFGFKYGNNVFGSYLGYYVKSYLVDGKPKEYIPIILQVKEDTHVEYIDTLSDDVELINTLDNFIHEMSKLVVVDTKPQEPINPYILIPNKHITSCDHLGNLTHKVDIGSLITLAYSQYMTGEHIYYANKDTIKFYAEAITCLNEIQFKLVNDFLSMAINHAKIYNMF